MKKAIIYILLIIGSLIGGFFIGNFITNTNYKNRSIEEIRMELMHREANEIRSYLSHEIVLKTKDEGGLFDTDYVQYLTGTISNNAAIASVKDIFVTVEFYSKAGDIISEKNIIFNKTISPGQSIKIKEKIREPEQSESFSFTIWGAKLANY